MDQRVGIFCPRSPKVLAGKERIFWKRRTELEGRLKMLNRRLEREQEMVDLHEASDDEMSVVSDKATSVDGFMKNRKKEDFFFLGQVKKFFEGNP